LPNGSFYSNTTRAIPWSTREVNVDCIPAIYVLLSENYFRSSQDPNSFVLHASALMPASRWILENHNEDETKILHDTAASLLQVIQDHNKKRINLRPSTLLAFAGGCADYITLITPASSNDILLRQLIEALLRLYVTSKESSHMLKDTIAVSLAAFAYALPERDNPIISELGSRISVLRLLREGLPGAAEQPPQSSQSMKPLMRFGVSGVLRFLSPTFMPIQDIRQCLEDLGPEPMDELEEVKVLPAYEGWRWYLEYRTHVVLACLRVTPSLGASEESSENDLAACLRCFSLPMNVSGLEYEPDVVVSSSISGMCQGRSEELWHEGLRLMGVSVKNRTNFSEDDLTKLASWGLLGHLFTASTASDPKTSPQAMRRLWELVVLILASTRMTPNMRILALDSLLRHEQFAGVQEHFTNHGLPWSIDDLHLEHILYGALEPMVSSGPVLEIDGDIIDVMVEHYAPSPIAPTPDTWDALPFSPRSETFSKWGDLGALFKARRARERWVNSANTLAGNVVLPDNATDPGLDELTLQLKGVEF
ncbi:hypothetical protein FRC09_003436, partial [Ceratobasidium sp. 395]